jgi:hypothetical protein
VDARATGAVAGRGISADDQMEAFRRSFVSNRDRAALTDIGKVHALADVSHCLYEGALALLSDENRDSVWTRSLLGLGLF